MILKIISLIFIFQKILLANNIPIDNQNINSAVYTQTNQSNTNIETTNSSEKKVVFLGSIEGIGIVILVTLTSLIGALFLRNKY